MSDEPRNASKDQRLVWWMHHLWELRPVRDLLWVLVFLFILWVSYVLRGVLLPMLIGFAAAYVVNPWLSYAERRWHWRRSLVIGTSIGVVLTTVLVTIALLVPLVIAETQQLIAKAPVYFETVLTNAVDHVDKKWIDDIRESTVDLPATATELLKGMLGTVGGTVGIVGSLLGTATYLFVATALVPLYFCYFAWNFNPMVARMKRWIPPANRSEVLRIAGRMDAAVGSFVRGRILIVVAMIVMFSVGFWLAKVPYWFLLGCLTGILSFVPYLAFVGCIFAILLTWLDVTSGKSSSTWVDIVVWPTVAYSVVQLLEGWLITPWIQSKSMEMSAVTVLVVLMVGGTIAGIYGLLLAIPVAGCLRILFQELVVPRLERHSQEQVAHQLDVQR